MGHSLSLRPIHTRNVAEPGYSLNSMSSFNTTGVGTGADLQENVYKESCFPIDYTKAKVKTASGKTKTVNMNTMRAPEPVKPVTYQSCVMACVPPANQVRGL